MTTYIAGPMSGLPRFNYPAFHEAEARWSAAGHQVASPAVGQAPDDYGDKSYEWYLRRALNILLVCDAIALLPGWQTSTGASLEVAIAKALKFPIFDAMTMEPLTDIDVVVAVA